MDNIIPSASSVTGVQKCRSAVRSPPPPPTSPTDCIVMILSLCTFAPYIIFRPFTTSKYELFAAVLQSSTPKYSGRSMFCGASSLYNFWGLLAEKEYKITNTKLGLKVNIYLE
jgi:hypothetical protein